MIAIAFFGFIIFAGVVGLLFGLPVYGVWGIFAGMKGIFTIPPSGYVVGTIVVAAVAFILSIFFRLIGSRLLQYASLLTAIIYTFYVTWELFSEMKVHVAVAVVQMVCAGLFVYSIGVLPALSVDDSVRQRQMRPVPHLLWFYPVTVAIYAIALGDRSFNGGPIGVVIVGGLIMFGFFGKSIREIKRR